MPRTNRFESPLKADVLFKRLMEWCGWQAPQGWKALPPQKKHQLGVRLKEAYRQRFREEASDRDDEKFRHKVFDWLDETRHIEQASLDSVIELTMVLGRDPGWLVDGRRAGVERDSSLASARGLVKQATVPMYVLAVRKANYDAYNPSGPRRSLSEEEMAREGEERARAAPVLFSSPLFDRHAAGQDGLLSVRDAVLMRVGWVRNVRQSWAEKVADRVKAAIFQGCYKAVDEGDQKIRQWAYARHPVCNPESSEYEEKSLMVKFWRVGLFDEVNLPDGETCTCYLYAVLYWFQEPMPLGEVKRIWLSDNYPSDQDRSTDSWSAEI